MNLAAVELDGASTSELVSVLSAVAAEIARREPLESPVACMELTEALARSSDQLESAMAGLISVVDRAGEAQRWGLPSTQAWLRSRLGMRDNRAKERLTLARQRHRLTETADHWADGTLSFGYAATIAGAVARLDDEDCRARRKSSSAWSTRVSRPARSPPSAAASAR